MIAVATRTANRTAIETTPENPGYQSFWLLRIGFTVVPILAGLDKFFNVMVDWSEYLAPWLNSLVPGTAQQFMYFVGAVEIVGGILVAVVPWIGGYVVAAWLTGIVVNLLSANPPEYYDIALRDAGLVIGAVVLGRLAQGVRAQRRASAGR